MLRLRTFGGAALLDESGPLTGTAVQKRRIALLSLLAAAGERGLSRDKLAALLWPDSDQERARHSLAQWLFTTRRDLRAEDLFLGTSELRLNPARMTSDVAEFDAAVAAGAHEDAVALHAGPFLDGFHLTGASEFERWADGERARLAASYMRALEALATAQAARGNARGALEAWRRLAAADPYNARVALGLMRAFEAAGDAAGGVTHARVYATLLREELGAEPQPEVLAYAEQLRKAPAAGTAAATSAASPAPAAATTAPTASASALESAAGVTVAHEAAAHGAPGSTAQRPADPVSPAPRLGRVRRRRRLLRRAGIVALAVALLGAGAWSAVDESTRQLLIWLATRDEQVILSRRIVVAPLENLTGDSALATFGRIAAVAVTSQLAVTGRFDVVDARTADVNRRIVDRIPRWFRDDDPAIAQAKEAGAGLLLSGNYHGQGDTLIVHMFLTDVADERVIRTLGTPVVASRRALDRLVDVLAHRSADMAAVAVDSAIAARALQRTFPSSYASYEASVEAWDRYFQSDLPGFYRSARRAAALDSTYMMPVLMEAYVRADAREWSRADSLVSVLRQHRATMSALETAGTDMLSAALAGDLPGHLAGALRVVQASPASPEVHTYAARVAVNANRPRQALEILAGVSPMRGVLLAAPWYWNWSSAAHHLLGNRAEERDAATTGFRRFERHETAVASYGRVLAADGDADALVRLLDRLPRAGSAAGHRRWKIALDWARELDAHGHAAAAQRLRERLAGQLARGSTGDGSARFHATVLGELGRHADALAAWTAIAAAEPDSLETLGQLGLAAARAGARARAVAVRETIASRSWPYAHGRDAMWQARIAATLGDAEGALGLVETALSRGYPRFFDPAGGAYDEPELHADPALRPLHRSTAFQRLLAPRG